MIHPHVCFGFDYDDESNTLIANDEVSNNGFFSTFTLLLTSIIEVYRKFDKRLPLIDGKNILLKLSKDKSKDMYHHFFEIDESIQINFDEEIPYFHPNIQHEIYLEENLKYLKPFFDRYFKLNKTLREKRDYLIQSYDVDHSKSISVIVRGTDKWTDRGGFITVGPTPYLILTENLVRDRPEHKVLLQVEQYSVLAQSQGRFNYIFFEETEYIHNMEIPLFSQEHPNKISWAEWYAAALWVHAHSDILITYTGNSALFLYLIRGNTKNLYQDISFTIPFDSFFVKDK